MYMYIGHTCIKMQVPQHVYVHLSHVHHVHVHVHVHDTPYTNVHVHVHVHVYDTPYTNVHVHDTPCICMVCIEDRNELPNVGLKPTTYWIQYICSTN